MHRTRLLAAAVLPLLLAADPAADRAARLKAKHDAAIEVATDAYWRQRLAADRAYLDGLQMQLKSSPGNADLTAARDQAQVDVTLDAEDLKSHTPVVTLADATEALKIAERKANMTPAVAKAIEEHKLLAGMTLDQTNEAMGVDGKQAGGDADGQTYEWTLSHQVPFQPAATGDDQQDLLRSRAAAANGLKTTVVDAVWSGRFEGGRLVSFAKQ